MPKTPWNKGLTKCSHPSVLKISRTLASKARTNFYEWQERNKPNYAAIKQSAALAELYGTILGDGYIEKFPRTERLIISFNSRESEHIGRIVNIVRALFEKEPKIRNRKACHCADVYLYQKNISDRLKFPTGKKRKYNLRIPNWIKNNRRYLLFCLKGLFESDGTWVVDESNYTSVVSFRNNLQSLLDDVFQALQELGFHPQRRKLDIRIAKKLEVAKFIKLIDFRKY